jgi:hypothetical protein
MAFVVDGSEWSFDGMTSAEIENALSRFAERTQVARDREEIVWVGDDLQTRAVLGGLGVWELKGSDSPVTLSEELWQELAAFFSMAPRYLDESDWPTGLTEHVVLTVDDLEPAANEDLAWAHHHVRSGSAVACLGLLRGGEHTTTSEVGTAQVHWVRTEPEHRAFFRAAIDVERDTEATLERLSPHAFPDLVFLPSVWRGLREFVGGYQLARGRLRQHLAVYDDHGAWAFTAPPPAEARGGPEGEGAPGQRLIERRFALLGVEVAPENPNVKADKDCREARERTIRHPDPRYEPQTVVLYCMWHGKLESFRNRIHIHPPVAHSGNRLVVAIFSGHLPLPGDR